MNTDPLWYFAYGSNLDPRTFVGRRRMRPLDTRVARLADYRLVFDLPVGKGERAVANVKHEAGARIHGVAYQITREQAQHLDRTEGVPRAYRRVAVQVEVPDGSLRAFTYGSSRRQLGRKPSPRYMNLLLHGARHHGLPASYIEELRNIELAQDERLIQLDLFRR